jgi:hypothetical protein
MLAICLARRPTWRLTSSSFKSGGKKLAPLGGFKIGIAWQGNPGRKTDRFPAAIPLKEFEPLAKISGSPAHQPATGFWDGATGLRSAGRIEIH